MQTIYLSPHFDDAALSCGGLIWEQVQRGIQVEVWTICAGLPPDGEMSEFAQELHERWGVNAAEVVASRKEEDRVSMGQLGVEQRYFNVPDAIYRRHPRTGDPLYPTVLDLFSGLDAGEVDVIKRLAIEFAASLPDGPVRLVAPLTVGNHADHLLVRQAAVMLDTLLAYYPDYPYTRDFPEDVDLLAPKGTRVVSHPISSGGLAAWQDSIAAYASQISSFWGSEHEMRAGIAEYSRIFGGVRLYLPPGWEV